MALAAFANTFGIYRFAIYLAGDGYGMLVKYPKARTAIDGPIEVFSLYVSHYNFDDITVFAANEDTSELLKKSFPSTFPQIFLSLTI